MNSPRICSPNTIFRRTGLVTAFLGAADSIYLLVLKYTQAESMCIGNHGCITVNNSSYSMIYGIPVSLLGLFAYLAIAIVFLLEKKWKPAGSYGPVTIFGLTLTGVLFTTYLTYIELYVIHAVCPFCILSAVLIGILFILAIIRLVRQN